MCRVWELSSVQCSPGGGEAVFRNLYGGHKAAFMQLNSCFLQRGTSHPNSIGTPLWVTTLPALVCRALSCKNHKCLDYQRLQKNIFRKTMIPVSSQEVLKDLFTPCAQSFGCLCFWVTSIINVNEKKKNQRRDETKCLLQATYDMQDSAIRKNNLIKIFMIKYHKLSRHKWLYRDVYQYFVKHGIVQAREKKIKT